MSRSAAVLLVAGVAVYAVAVIATEPFEQPNAETLYRSIRDGIGRYRLVNGLATVGLILVVVGSAGLVRATAGPRAGLRRAGLALLLVGGVLWLVEVTVRVTWVMDTAVTVGRVPPMVLPAGWAWGWSPCSSVLYWPLLRAWSSCCWDCRTLGH